MIIFNRKFLIPSIAIIGLLLLIASYAGLFNKKINPGQRQIKGDAIHDYILITKAYYQYYESAPATVKAKQATSISSRILAGIDAVNVRASDRVNNGDILIILSHIDLESRVSQAKAEVDAIIAKLKEANLNLKRATELSTKKLISRSDYDKAEATQNRLVANLTKAKQSLLEAKTNLDFATIKSPIDGIIVDRMAEPGDTAQPGLTLLSIYNPNSLRVEANVREKLALKLKIGDSLQVIIDATNQTLEAEIEEIVPAGNPGSRSFLVKARLQSNIGLLPGMYATINIPSKRKHLIAIQKDYIIEAGQLNIIWLENNGKIIRRIIKLGEEINVDKVEVVAGLLEGEHLVRMPRSNK